jgi:DNA-binding NarL/FixJ family response regulator
MVEFLMGRPARDLMAEAEEAEDLAMREGPGSQTVAEALFISVKTVEANLSRIFHKLGVRSRTELSRRIATTHRVSPDSSPPHEA